MLLYFVCICVISIFGLIRNAVGNQVDNVHAMPIPRTTWLKRMTDADRYAEGNYTEQNQKSLHSAIPVHTTESLIPARSHACLKYVILPGGLGDPQARFNNLPDLELPILIDGLDRPVELFAQRL
jgi:hypothetical protein